MGTAIKLMFKRIGLPCLILGLIVGAVFMIKLNVFRPTYYKVTELCSGEDCQMFVDKAKEMKQEYDSDLAESRLRQKLAERIAQEKIIEASKASTELGFYKSLLEEAYPQEFYCYTDKKESIDISYQEEKIVGETYKVQGMGFMDKHPKAACALCGSGKEYEIRCREDYSDWDAQNEYEYDNCAPCWDGWENRWIQESCRTGVIDKTTTVLENKTFSIDLQRDKINVVPIPENYTYEQKLDLTRKLKEYGCYASRQITESSLYDSRRDVLKKQLNEISLSSLTQGGRFIFTITTG